MAKHKKVSVNLEIPYEANTISVSGIMYFSAGLFLLIVVTFGLMWIMLDIMEKQAVESKSSDNPLALSKDDALPPEPRLQAAPGFRVETKNGFKNFELGAPQAEYWELLKQWEKIWNEGVKDEKTGTVVSLPIAEAKRKLLEQNAKTADNGSAQQSRTLMSDSSAGRTASVTIR